MKRAPFIGSALAAVTLPIVGAGRAAIAAPSPSATNLLPTVMAQGGGSTSFLPLAVAAGKGYYAQEGLDLAIKQATGPNAVNAVLAGDALIGASSFPLAFPAIQRGQPLVFVGSVMTEDVAVFMISSAAAKRAGFRSSMTLAQKIQLLRGMKIAITAAGAGVDVTLRSLLKQEGIAPDRDVTITPVGSVIANMLAALKSGAVDAAVYDSVTAAQAEKDGIAQILIDAVGGEIPSERGEFYIGIYAQRGALAPNADALVAMNRALYRALQLLRKDRKNAEAAAAPYFPGIDPDVFRRALDLAHNAYPPTPVITDAALATAVKILGAAEDKHIDTPQSQFVDNTFAAKAVAQVDARK